MYTKIIITGIFVWLGLSVNAQPWTEYTIDKKSETEKGDFYLLQDQFERYWDGRKIEKGKGWQQFRRWEHFMEPRVYPEGKLNLPSYQSLVRDNMLITADEADWKPLGPDLVPPLSYDDRFSGAGRLNTVAFHPTNANIMYAGAPSGGLWKTIDGGTTWTSIGDQLASLGVSDIAINPQDPNIIYIATGDGDSGDTYGSGILKSTNGGSTWFPTQFSLDLSETYYFRRIIIDPSNPNILYTTSNKGLFRTDDGFQTYKLLRSGHFKDLEFHPTNPQIVYATEYYSTGVNAKIFRIKNNGLEIKILFSGLDLSDKARRVELAVTPANPDAVYALASSVKNGGLFALYKSSDQGNSFTKIYDDSKLNLLGWDMTGDDSGGQGWYDLALAVDPDDENKIFVGGINIWETSNGGANWNINAHWIGDENTDYVHADHHMLVYSPVTKDLFSCNDGGLHKSTNKGVDWVDLSDGFSILQVYKTSASQSMKDLFVTGNQDNGSFMRRNGQWAEVTGGDGMDCLVKPDDSDVLITSYYYGNFWISRDAGETFYSFGPSQERGGGAWVTPIIVSEKNPDHIYVAYKNIYKSVDFGETWIPLSNSLTDRINFRSIAVSPSNEDYIYASTYEESFRTKNGGISWEKISDNLPDLSIMSVAVSPNNPEKIWLSLSGFDAGEKVYMSEDAGDTWVNYSEGLPNIPTNFIKSHKNHNGALYLGTDHGIYYRDNSLTQWALFNKGLPNVIVNDIEIQDNFDRIIVGTYGRGLWESSFYPTNSAVPYGEIYPLNKYSCLNEEAGFYIESVNSADSVVWNFNNEKTVTAALSDTAYVAFPTKGMKNIFATIYKTGSNTQVSFKNYFEVTDSVKLIVGSTDISDYHSEEPATLFAMGANTFEWVSDIEIADPYNSSITVSVRDTTSFIVTGSIGSCQMTDTITINVIPGPDNDKICDAYELSFGANGPFTNVDASTELNEPLPDTSDCNTQYSWCNESGLQNTVWFKYVALESTNTFITTGFDTQIAIYEAVSCDSLLDGKYTLIAANDDYFGANKKYAAALNSVELEPGKQYWIQIDGSAGGEEGEFYLYVFHSPVGIEELMVENQAEFNIFPNPSNGGVNIQYLSESSSKIELYDLKGRKIMEKYIDHPGMMNETINVKNRGIYIIRVLTTDRIFNRKLIIE
ncbi:MAG: T9SS type A sorting domain-containing protein [Bacteroidales bacterium]|nr:T9SS type A sorting domain-containing protein [Bacteroidales bacterium]MCF8389530.1 T9SS type A sorting domain-containing protein [Bacteroidales bacterium]